MMEKCWNYNSQRYWQTARFEKCLDCGIECDYHGGGANELYDAAMERRWADERRKEWEEEFNVDLTVIPIEITEVKFNYL